MAFDLPNSPTVNQIAIGPGGIQYQWDGVKWVALGLSSSAGPIGIRIFTASGTYVPTIGTGTVIVECQGGGGGGGGATGVASGSTWGYGGGGGGGYSRRSLTAVQIGASVAITIGAGGAGGVSGGATSFGSFCIANGGNGNGASTGAAGGAAAGTGDLAVVGWAGNYGGVAQPTVSGMYIFSGAGGNSRFGTGGAGLSGAPTGSNGSPAVGYGSGGSGGYVGNSGGAGTGGAGAPGLCIVTEYAPLGQSGALAPIGAVNNIGRNIFHNALFNVQQRGVGPWTGAISFTADRWQGSAVNDTATATIVALADADRTAIGDEAATSAIQLAVTGSATAGSYTQFLQRIESLRRLANKTVTVSFWARATSGTPRLGVGWLQLFGTGGSPSAAVSGNIGVTAALSTTWQRYVMSVALPSAAGKTFGTTAGTDLSQIEWWLSDQGTYSARSGGIGVQTGTVQFWGLQLEIGSVATPLEKLDPRLDLANCQRFYYQGVPPVRGVATSTTGVSRMATMHPVTMRAVPTVTLVTALPLYDGSVAVTFTSITANYCTVTALEIEGSASAGTLTAGRPLAVYQQAGGLLTVSADL